MIIKNKDKQIIVRNFPHVFYVAWSQVVFLIPACTPPTRRFDLSALGVALPVYIITSESSSYFSDLCRLLLFLHSVCTVCYKNTSTAYSSFPQLITASQTICQQTHDSAHHASFVYFSCSRDQLCSCLL